MQNRIFNRINAFTISVLAVGLGSVSGQQTLTNVNEKGVVIDGYDPVAYFTVKAPVQGSHQYQSEYNGLIYYFSSAENKQLFDSNPSGYEVQFGGFCAYAVSQGHVSPIDPAFCLIQKDKQGVDRLICQHNQKASDLWNRDPDGLLINADNYWPAVVKNGGKQINIKGVERFFINIDKDGLANQGYDVVAYHTEGRARPGESKYAEWFHGAKYHFSSAENRELFRTDPKQYLPQYGGFCGYAMSLGRVRPVNPEIFQIVDGRLMLQHTQEAFDLFNKDLVGNIKKADSKWPQVQEKNAGHKVKYDKLAM